MCGKKVAILDWEYSRNLKSSELLKILKQMENLAYLKLDIDVYSILAQKKRDGEIQDKDEISDINVTSVKKFKLIAYRNAKFFERDIKFTELEELTLEQVEVGYEIIAKISRFSKLEKVCFNVCRFNDSLGSIRLWCNLTNLKYLIVNPDVHIGLPFSFLKEFRYLKCESLENLEFFSNNSAGCTPTFLEDISKNLPNLKNLDINTLTKVNFFAKYFTNLERLSLSYCEFCDETSFIEIDTGIVHERLKDLKLRFPHSIPQEILEVFEIFPNLEYFELDENTEWIIIDKKFVYTILKQKKLKFLILNFAALPNCMEFIEDFKTIADKLDYVKMNVFFCYEDEKFDDKKRRNVERFRESLKSQYKMIDGKQGRDVEIIKILK